MKTWLIFIFTGISICSYAQHDFDFDGLNDAGDVKHQLNSSGNKKVEADFVSSIPAPSDWIGDIAFDGAYLWTGSKEGWLYKLQPETGEVLDKLDISIALVDGLAFDGEFLWVAEANESDLIQKIDTSTGDVAYSFNHNVKSYATHGMAYVNNQIWINMFYINSTDTTFVFDTTGNIVDKHPNLCGSSHGLAFDGDHFWISANYSGTSSWSRIYQYSKEDFARIAYINAPGGQYPNGLDFFEGYLWVSNADYDSIYKVDIGLANSITPEKTKNSHVSLYPNPFQNVLHIHATDNSVALEIEIYDINGKKVARNSAANHDDLQFDHLGAGAYFYLLKRDQVILQRGKLIKTNM